MVVVYSRGLYSAGRILAIRLLVIGYQYLTELFDAVVVETDIVAFDGVGIVSCRPILEERVCAPTIVGDVGYSEAYSAPIQIVKQSQQVALDIFVP